MSPQTIDPDAAIVRNLTAAANEVDPHPELADPTDRDRLVAVPAFIVAQILRDSAGMYVAVSELFPDEAADRAQAAPCDPAVQLADFILDRWPGK